MCVREFVLSFNIKLTYSLCVHKNALLLIHIHMQIMGRQSIERKKIKRKNQKKRKRLVLKRSTHSGVDQDSTESETSATELSLSVGDTCTVDDASDGHIPSDKEVSDDELFAAFDRIGEDSDEYWEKLASQKIREFESFHDKHPCIVTDKKRYFEVCVDGTGQFKGTAALQCVDIKTFINSLMEKEAKATDLCRMMRDRIETLESSLKDSKVKMVNMYRKNQRNTEKVRFFWRNKIYEGNSRGAEMLKSALIYPDMIR